MAEGLAPTQCEIGFPAPLQDPQFGHGLSLPDVTYAVDPSAASAQRHIRLANDRVWSTSLPCPRARVPLSSARDVYDLAWLQRDAWPSYPTPHAAVSVVDLFAGCGGMTLGVTEAMAAAGLDAKHVLALDSDANAAAVYRQNFPEAPFEHNSIEALCDGELGSAPTSNERNTLNGIPEGLDIVLGGPPCQGHSDLNNHTRRRDPKNRLYLRMVRFAELTRPKFLIIENVPGVVHDSDRIVSVARTALTELGYHVDETLLTATDHGVAQSRRRHVLVASTEIQPRLRETVVPQGTPVRTVDWAFSDLLGTSNTSIFDTPSTHSQVNRRRLAYLYNNGVYELPDSERPDCHRTKKHSYKSVYGRMRWDRAAPTITGGFGSIGQGRFGHPSEQRSITPHEAARLQTFPDFFTFNDVKRRALQQLIGNAVPPFLAYAVALPIANFLSSIKST